jgi:hypothetical protein
MSQIGLSNITNKDLKKAEICSEKDNIESKMTPKLRAKSTGDSVTELGKDIVGYN